MFFQCTQYDNFLSFVCTSCAACGAANRAALTFGIWQLFSGVLLALELGEWCLVLRTFFTSLHLVLCVRGFSFPYNNREKVVLGARRLPRVKAPGIS